MLVVFSRVGGKYTKIYKGKKYVVSFSPTGTRTQVDRGLYAICMKAGYPNQLDYRRSAAVITCRLIF